jgi:UDP-N-acetylmuramate--alanine ligase
LARENDFACNDICTYSISDETASLHIKNLSIVNGAYAFEVVNTHWNLQNVILNMGGLHNVENALAAIGVAKYLKIDNDKILAAVASFKGVKRRFEYVLITEKNVLIDDYAHHPEELRALIVGAKNLFPNLKCTVVFQPHLFSRTNDLAVSFAEVLSLADETILLPIYPARELPMQGVTSSLILDKMINRQKSIKEKDELLQYINANNTELLIIAGAGDIDTLVLPLKNILEK